MDALTAITTRVSANKLSEPAPDRSQLQTILDAAVAAPDHGRLRPWRFIVIEGAARDKLADGMLEIRARKGDVSDEDRERERAKAYRAPTIVAVAAHIVGERIPAVEQISAVAAATQNMFLAAHAMGFGAMWKTGDAAYDDAMKARLGLEAGDTIVGFLYLGTASAPRAPMPRSTENLVTYLSST